VNHVYTQLPYALTAAGVSLVGYLLAGFLGFRFRSNLALMAAPFTLALMVVTILVIRAVTSKDDAVETAPISEEEASDTAEE
jgi:hypothetical protein